MTNREYALLAAKTLSDKKAEDITVIDIQGKATFAVFCNLFGIIRKASEFSD